MSVSVRERRPTRSLSEPMGCRSGQATRHGQHVGSLEQRSSRPPPPDGRARGRPIDRTSLEAPRSPIAGLTRTPADTARYLCSAADVCRPTRRHADAPIGRSDRAAGLALTIQIVAIRSRRSWPAATSLRRQPDRAVADAPRTKAIAVGPVAPRRKPRRCICPPAFVLSDGQGIHVARLLAE